MARVITNLTIDLQPLKNWLTQSGTTILIVIGNGKGAGEAKVQIKKILDEAGDEYPDVEFGYTTQANTIKPDLSGKGITGFEEFALISISPSSKKLVSTVLDSDLIGNPGWIQQAITEAEAA